MKKRVAVIICLILLTACTTTGPAPGGQTAPEAAGRPGSAFWKAISPYCGEAFRGRVESARPGDESWVEADIRVHIRHCGESRLLMPLNVDGDRSRTWILERSPWGVQLKHAHRHEDGTPDRLSAYGGLARPPTAGTSLVFPADDETRALLPRASGNTWRLAVTDQTLVYELTRTADDERFRLVFDLSDPVPAPPAPHGWNDLGGTAAGD